MTSHRSSRWLKRGLAASALAATFVGALPARAYPWANRTNFASPRFESVWRAADLPVQQGTTNRSWTWGPGPWFDYKEFYKQSPNGLRQVQYLDKSRMEINNPAETGGALGGVTNGLLPVEMVSGRIKLGDSPGPDQNEQRDPAVIPVAGDPLIQNPNAPTYSSFASVATTDNGYRDQNKVGQRAGATFNKSGSVGFRQDLADQPGAEIVAYETVTGHNVPRVFEDFRNAGPVPAITAFGFPITDPYWITARVGGQDKDILVQIYERRVITYTPSNPAAFRVEMGNVGQHYFQWRYPHLGMPWVAPQPALPIVFASKRSTDQFNLYTMDASGNAQSAITGGAQETVAFSIRRSWEPTNVRIFGDTRRYGDKRQLVTMLRNGGDLQRLLHSDSNDYNASVSPDGTKVAFVSDRDGNPDLYMLGLRGLDIMAFTRLTDTFDCVNQYPTWLPDGSGIVYESNCQNGNFEIYRGDLNYTEDRAGSITFGRLISPVGDAARLTNNSTDDRFPRVSPDGARIAFTATRDGASDIYTMTIEGGQQARITTANRSDEAPTWSPDGSQLVFNSNRDGDHEIMLMNLDGSGQVQLTNNGSDDGWSIWAQ